jgi:hypothetical protein
VACLPVPRAQAYGVLPRYPSFLSYCWFPLLFLVRKLKC